MSDKVTLTNAQRDALIEEFVQIQLDSMDTESLYELASEYILNSFDKLTDSEIKERVESLYDSELYDELVDNVTNEIAPLNVTVTDDNYGDKVDTLVSNMAASNDKEFTHDSEGC